MEERDNTNAYNTASLDDLKENLDTFCQYLAMPQDSEERAFANSLVKYGICFIVFRKGPDQPLIFAPSKFLGFYRNSMEKHNRFKKSYKIFTQNNNVDFALQIFGKTYTADQDMEQKYFEFCKSLGETPKIKATFGNTRRYLFVEL